MNEEHLNSFVFIGYAYTYNGRNIKTGKKKTSWREKWRAVTPRPPQKILVTCVAFFLKPETCIRPNYVSFVELFQMKLEVDA